MNRVSAEEIKLLHLISEFSFALHHAMEQPFAECSFIWVEQMIEDIKRGVVALAENHLIDSSNVIYSVVLRLLNASCCDMYKLSELFNAYDPMLISLVTARKYYLFPNMVEL